MSRFEEHLTRLSHVSAEAGLQDILRGLEKESLRVDPKGTLARTGHPRALGSALTHPHITTDYSEALLEFITEPHRDIDALLAQLEGIHRYTYSVLEQNDEVLWPASMPCSLGPHSDIPVARYGSSHSGTMKTVYRLGLGHRYGRAMQTIAGVHYNFSLPDTFWRQLQQLEGDSQPLQSFKTARYFDLIRNFRRYSWLLIYLFGAAPGVCRSFVRDRAHQLEPFRGDEHSLYSPFATSLRMGDLGYQSDAQQALQISYNDLPSYMQTLCQAITRPHPAYQAIGLIDAKGDYQQLNTGLLQIENEFYSSIRPKRTTRRGETALSALRDRGVEYIEVRCLDLNPFDPLGISASQIRFIDAFLIYCLLEESPLNNGEEHAELRENQHRIVYRGRDPRVSLLRSGQEVGLRDWAESLTDRIARCATLLDDANGGDQFCHSISEIRPRISHPEWTPAARLLAEMDTHEMSFLQYTLALARRHTHHFKVPLAEKQQAAFAALAETSLAEQAALERADEGTFEDYLARYYNQYHDCQCSGRDTEAVSSAP
ncbi:glutamate--cysteine ligase [Marinimicrobium alkaliphilum]|uniref:glutamate--cysteine ligase n=1 Tax=Marinimicrobium alkaliphilum TaxID=2202654 RepID=UPI000DB99C02|nr:glutamate--cysteine ligase [Marinimicrobium alkaliphilum]